jgi:hypothetical protein
MGAPTSEVGYTGGSITMHWGILTIAQQTNKFTPLILLIVYYYSPTCFGCFAAIVRVSQKNTNNNETVFLYGTMMIAEARQTCRWILIYDKHIPSVCIFWFVTQMLTWTTGWAVRKGILVARKERKSKMNKLCRFTWFVHFIWLSLITFTPLCLQNIFKIY